MSFLATAFGLGVIGISPNLVVALGGLEQLEEKSFAIGDHS